MILRILTFLFFVIWFVYWGIEEKKADKEKPKTPMHSFSKYAGYIGVYAIHFFVGLQLLRVIGVVPFENTPLIQLFGFLLVIAGMAISISARIVLSTNWANAYEYQIKKNHELITEGIYKYIRHPIYSGIVISLIGAEVVAGSYLFISFFGFFFALYIQAKREEKILLVHFGKKYEAYMKKTKIFIPFIL